MTAPSSVDWTQDWRGIKDFIAWKFINLHAFYNSQRSRTLKGKTPDIQAKNEFLKVSKMSIDFKHMAPRILQGFKAGIIGP